jgi:hypothetical protein
MTFDNVSTFLRQDHHCTVIAGSRRKLHEIRVLEMPEVARPGPEVVPSVAEVEAGTTRKHQRLKACATRTRAT